jgi:hypothetical protein
MTAPRNAAFADHAYTERPRRLASSADAQHKSGNSAIHQIAPFIGRVAKKRLERG